MQISNSPNYLRQISQTDAGNKASSAVNNQQDVSRVEFDKDAQLKQNQQNQKNRLEYDQEAIALFEQQSSQQSSQLVLSHQNGVNQTNTDKTNSTGYDQPSEQNLNAVAAYESIGNLSQRDKIQQTFGVDLLA